MRRPDFFIVGAPRCATVALRNSLNAHPDIYMPLVPEPAFFNDDLNNDPSLRTDSLEMYLDLFKDAGSARCVGEKTAWYLASEVAARKIRSFNPSARIIITLRNPLQQMRSLHAHRVANGDEDILDFAAALNAEPERAAGQQIPETCKRPYSLLYRHSARYAAQVQRFLDAFGPEQVFVNIFENLIARPEQAHRQIFEFLGVDPQAAPSFDQYNSASGHWIVRSARRLVRVHPWCQPIIAASGAGKLRRIIRRHVGQSKTSAPSFDPQLQTQLMRDFDDQLLTLSEMLGIDLFDVWQWNHSLASARIASQQSPARAAD